MMTLWQMSLSGGLLILAVALVRSLTLNRLPKKTFLILWKIAILRLLLPISIPSLFSAWSFVLRHEPLRRAGMETPVQLLIPTTSQKPAPAAFLPLDTAAPPAQTISPWLALWAVGVGICILFFFISWIRCRLRFAVSLPVTEDFIQDWIKAHPLPDRRIIRIRQSDQIRSPLTYGIFHPVILLPKNTDWNDQKTLSWILLHESVHIRRYDALSKLLSTFTLCIHWFNPAVHLMSFLMIQDLELACDESVIQSAGQDSRSSYALTLIRLEEHKSGLFPLESRFSTNAVEERITSIMKTRRNSVFAVITAVLLVISMTAVFTTSAAPLQTQESLSFIPDTPFSETDYQKLLALRFDGYEQMSVLKYRQKVGELTDTWYYHDLLERFSQDEQIYALRDENEIASFLHYILNPLAGDQWQIRVFAGYAASDFPVPADNAILEYNITLSILDGNQVTVQQYDNARAAIAEGLQAFLQDRTIEELSSENFMNEQIHQRTEELVSRWSTDSLHIAVDTSYMPLSDQNDSGRDSGENTPNKGITLDRYASYLLPEDRENREYPNATEADYRALLTLMTDDYPDILLRDFNEKVLEWGNEDSTGSLDRIFCDLSCQDRQVTLTPEEQTFVEISVRLSSMENAKFVQSHYTGRLEEDPVIAERLLPKQTADGAAICDLYCQFSWHITDKEQLTVHQRDQAVAGLFNAVWDFWEETTLDEGLAMTKEEIVSHLNSLAQEYSTDQITISVLEDNITFETMDERGLRY